MLWSLLSNRLIQGGIAFCVLIIGGSLVYSWHVRRITEQEMEQHKRFLEGKSGKTNARSPIKSVRAPDTNGTAGTLVETPAGPDTRIATDTQTSAAVAASPSDNTIEEASAQEVPVSPYGFGPYPELPPEWEGAFPPVSLKHELMVRVSVKLREQGINVDGASMEDGYVFPNIRGIYYVEWKVNGEGMRYISAGTGHPEDGERIFRIRDEKGRALTEADIPSDIQLVPYEEGRIDPYDFLGFQR